MHKRYDAAPVRIADVSQAVRQQLLYQQLSLSYIVACAASNSGQRGAVQPLLSIGIPCPGAWAGMHTGLAASFCCVPWNSLCLACPLGVMTAPWSCLLCRMYRLLYRFLYCLFYHVLPCLPQLQDLGAVGVSGLTPEQIKHEAEQRQRAAAALQVGVMPAAAQWPQGPHRRQRHRSSHVGGRHGWCRCSLGWPQACV